MTEDVTTGSVTTEHVRYRVEVWYKPRRLRWIGGCVRMLDLTFDVSRYGDHLWRLLDEYVRDGYEVRVTEVIRNVDD